MSGPLAGIRVLDLTTIAMGPYASQWLGDFGADVVKVETPGGDSTRQTGPATEAGMAALFLGTNRNKRSIVLDLKNEAAREALLRLVDGADVLMHNIRPQKLAGLGLEREGLLQRNPRLVFAGLHGFGEAGPYGGRPAYDDIIQGLSGCVALMAMGRGEPSYFPTITADKTTGLIAAMAIQAALLGRERTGKGSFVEIPMFECMTAVNLQEHLFGCHFDPPIAPIGYPRVLSPHRRPYRTLDGHVCMMPYTDAHWRAFFREAGRPDLVDDARFARMADRTIHIDALYDLVALLVAKRTSADWLDTCDRLAIPAAPVLGLDDLLSDPHLNQVGFFSEIEDPDMGRIRLAGVPVLFDGKRPPCELPPRLGAHTREILEEAGIDQCQIDTVIATGSRRTRSESKERLHAAKS